MRSLTKRNCLENKNTYFSWKNAVILKSCEVKYYEPFLVREDLVKEFFCSPMRPSLASSYTNFIHFYLYSYVKNFVLLRERNVLVLECSPIATGNAAIWCLGEVRVFGIERVLFLPHMNPASLVKVSFLVPPMAQPSDRSWLGLFVRWKWKARPPPTSHPTSDLHFYRA